jgi:SSS family solute:Na+ symporter
MYLILNHLPNGWSDVVTFASANNADKFAVLNLKLGDSIWEFLSSPYTLIGGLLGGTFLTMASHGTDQLLVQRLLGCKSKRDSQKALILDASLIVLQFLFFLILGLCLYAYYNGSTLHQLGLKSSDEIFPKFIIEKLPVGISGFVIAGVLASAMGSLSSSISSLASSTYLDLFRQIFKKINYTLKKEIFLSRLFTLIWGIFLIGGAMLFTDTKNPVVELGLKIASITYGGLLGTFFLGLLFKRIDSIDSYIGFISSLIIMVLVLFYTKIDYTWHTFIGCAFCILIGNLSWFLRNKFFLKTKELID